MARLKDIYNNELAPKLKAELGLDNVMEVPSITKITLNMGVGEALGDKKVLEHAVSNLEQISGQKVVVTRARKSIAGFKVERRLANWLQSHLKTRAYVRVFRSPNCHCYSSDS